MIFFLRLKLGAIPFREFLGCFGQIVPDTVINSATFLRYCPSTQSAQPNFLETKARAVRRRHLVEIRQDCPDVTV
jgi:hypothetical protein